MRLRPPRQRPSLRNPADSRESPSAFFDGSDSAPAGARKNARRQLRRVRGKNKKTVMTKVRATCTSDAMSLCSGMLMSMDRVVSCLQAKKTQLSPKCRAQFDKGA
jgi:hypothetical protein